MAADLQQIAYFLDNLGWDYRIDEQEERIITGVESDNVEDFLIVVQLDEDGKFFRLFAPQVLSGVTDHPHKVAILQTMLSISWETKMLQWEYDPSDGEIRAIIEFPLEDSILTEKQFKRCLHGLIQLVDNVAIPRLTEVMKTGHDPGNVDLGERILLSIQQQAPGLLELLEKAMQARKRRGSFPSE